MRSLILCQWPQHHPVPLLPVSRRQSPERQPMHHPMHRSVLLSGRQPLLQKHQLHQLVHRSVLMGMRHKRLLSRTIGHPHGHTAHRAARHRHLRPLERAERHLLHRDRHQRRLLERPLRYRDIRPHHCPNHFLSPLPHTESFEFHEERHCEHHPRILRTGLTGVLK